MIIKLYDSIKLKYDSDNETFGMVYREAMLVGCVTIVSEVDGVDDVIVDG